MRAGSASCSACVQLRAPWRPWGGGKGERDLEVVPLARSLSLPESHTVY